MNDNITNRYSVRHNPPTKGTRVRIYDIDVHSDYEGHEATVTDMSIDTTTCYAEVKSIQKPDDTLQVRFASYEIVDPAPEPDVDALKLAVSALTAEKERLERDVQTFRTRADTYATDFSIVGEALMEEAENRGWCDEYDRFVENVNVLTSLLDLPEREREYEVVVTGTATVSWSHPVTVTARSADEAIEMVENNPSAYFDMDEAATDALNYGYGWDSNDIDDVNIN